MLWFTREKICWSFYLTRLFYLTTGFQNADSSQGFSVWGSWQTCPKKWFTGCQEGERTRSRIPLPKQQTVTHKKCQVFSCLGHLKKASSKMMMLSDGVYNVTFKDHPRRVYCDMTQDGGGWILVLINHGDRLCNNQYQVNNIWNKREHDPRLDHDFSMLAVADEMRKQSKASVFQYRLEATRGNWGGIWEAPADYSLLATSDHQTNVTEVQKFGSWHYHKESIRRVPWVDVEDLACLLGMRAVVDDNWWATLVQKASSPAWGQYNPVPWIGSGLQLTHISPIYYWFRME